MKLPVTQSPLPMEKNWLSHYPADVPAHINPDTYSSLVDQFDHAVRRFADRPAFINFGRVLTYRQLESKSRAFAAYLQHLRLPAGTRIALMMPNLLQYPVALFGILRAGMTVVNINPLYKPAELAHHLNDSGAAAIIVNANFAHTLAAVVKQSDVRHIVVTEIGDELSGLKGLLMSAVVKYLKKGVPDYHLPTAVAWKTALAIGSRLKYAPPPVKSSDLAFLQYTGATTGLAKGAMLTHRNILANVAQIKAAYGPLLQAGNETMVTALPLYHIFALAVNCLLFVEMGGCNLLITNGRDIPGLVKTLRRQPFTAISGVNTLYRALLNNQAFTRLDFGSLKLSVAGGMPIQQTVADRWQSLTGSHLLEGYGLTEASPLVSGNPHNLQHYSGSIGLPIPSTDIRVVDDAGNAVAAGQPGELLVRGPQVMAGYWRQPEASAEVLKDGWLSTGDVVTVDSEGFFHIVDRKKDIILVSGFNVYPNEIEAVVNRHPKVSEAAAIGIPCDNTGEAIKLVVVKKDPSLTGDELVNYCRRYLTGYKVPRMIVFCDALPLSAVGKVLRKQLRSQSVGQQSHKTL